MPHPPRSTSLARILAVALTAGCASAGHGESEGLPDVIPVELTTWVYVTNNNQLDIRVFAFDNTQSITLGSVPSFTTESFELPRSILGRGQVRIMADPIGEPTAYVTPLINFSPGQDIEVIVQNNLALSTYSLR